MASGIVLMMVMASRHTDNPDRAANMKRMDTKAPSTSRPAALSVVFELAHLRRTGLTSLIVGSWLTAINQWDVLALHGLDAHLALKIVMNFLTPFVVANIGLLSRKHDP